MNLLFGVVFCTFLAFIWIEYFRRIDIFENERKRLLILVFFLGIFSTFFVDLVHHFIAPYHLRLTGEWLNDFLYCFFVIGLTEEISKFLPFLFVLIFFRKHLNDPVDYIVYAAISAIGFACFENILYFIDHGFRVIAVRSVTALPSHIFDTTIFIYGFILYRFNPLKKDKLVVISYMFFAILSHGLYDFFLLGKLQFGYFCMLFYYLLLISIFVTILGNALNNSAFYSPKKFIDSKKLTEFMLLMYMLLWVLTTGFYISTSPDKIEMIGFFASMVWKDLFLVLVLIFRTSRFKIIPGRWNRIKLELPFSLQFREVYKGPPEPSNLKNYVTPALIRVKIKGETYNETYLNYFFGKNLIVQPVSRRYSFLKKRYKGILDLKLFLKDDEVFYVLIVFTELGTEYFYIKSKAKGRQRFGKYPIVALLKGPPLAEINEHHSIEDFKFLEWLVLKTTK